MALATELEETAQITSEKSRYRIETVYDEKDKIKIVKFSMPANQAFGISESSLPSQSIALDYETHSSQAVPPTSKRREAVIDIPEIKGMEMHNPTLTSRTRALMHIFWAIVVSKALQTSFPLEKATVAVFKDPIEGRRQVVLQVFTRASAAQAIAFWRGLESDLQDWTSRLDNPSRQHLLNNISLRIHWNEHGHK